jgi:hypothetical protein
MGTTSRATAAALVALAAAATPAAAAERTPDRLLNAYPLEQRPATVASAPAPAAAPPRTARSHPAAAEPPRLTQGGAIAIAIAAMLLAGVVVTRRRRGAEVAWASAVPVAGPAVAERPAPAGDAPPALAEPEPEIEPAPEPEPEPPPSAALPARAARDGVLCQVRWECDGRASWFAAVTTKDRERETVADSSDFFWRETDPPPRTPEAQAALRDLMDELRAAGWRPVRGRGRQQGAPRWYARRFVLLAEEEPLDTPLEGVA